MARSLVIVREMFSSEWSTEGLEGEGGRRGYRCAMLRAGDGRRRPAHGYGLLQEVFVSGPISIALVMVTSSNQNPVPDTVESVP